MLLAALASSPHTKEPPLVLLVEDHLDTRQMYAQFLSLQFAIAEAPDAEQALTMIHGRAPRLVITDLSLPGMSGFEMIERLKGDPTTRDIPVICLSGFGGRGHEERARELGCNLVLQKPCLPDELADAAASVLREGEPQS
jgi:CheY-like chemotaxis protein